MDRILKDEIRNITVIYRMGARGRFMILFTVSTSQSNSILISVIFPCSLLLGIFFLKKIRPRKLGLPSSALALFDQGAHVKVNSFVGDRVGKGVENSNFLGPCRLFGVQLIVNHVLIQFHTTLH